MHNHAAFEKEYMYHVICGGAHNGGRPTVHSMVARRWPAGSGAVRGSRGGGAGRLCRGDAGVSGVVILLQLERALLQADDAVADVLGVRVDSRRHDPRHVVREEVGRVEARVARSVPPALPVFL